MIFHLTASKDAYITNKIVDGSSRSTTANTGYASTIDMFKLYGESTLRGYKGSCAIDGAAPIDYSGTETECLAETGGGVYNTNLIENSRGLIYFDLAHLSASIMSAMDASAVSSLISDQKLKIKLMMYDVQGTQVAPADYTLELWGLTKAWDEGLGDNVVTFGDKMPASWSTASIAGGAWSATGGDIDASWDAADDSADDDLQTYIASQVFTTGEENLEMDVTTWVKALWSSGNTNVQTNYGWILKFTAAQETNAYSYFVKRFATRHSRNPFLRPKLVATWEDYFLDDRLDFEANQSNNLFIRNYVQGTPSDVSGTLAVKLSYGTTEVAAGSFAKHSSAGIPQNGLYKSSALQVLSTNSTISSHLITSGSVLLQEEWTADSVTIYSGSINLKRPMAVSSSTPTDYRFSILGLKSTYTIDDEPVVRLFVRDKTLANEAVRIPIQLPSQIIQKVYFQIKDTNSQQVLIPFSDVISVPDESTRVSADGEGMFFKFPASVLPRGRTYTIDIAYYDRGERRVHEFNKAFRIK